MSVTETRPKLTEADHFRLTIPPMLSFVSGYVDTTGFLGLYGLLTPQVSGAFVAAGAAFVHREQGLISKLLAMPMFIAGAALMTLLVAVLRRRRTNPMPVALGLVSALIACFLIAAMTGSPFASPDAPAAITTAIVGFLAMGAESALVRVLFKGSVPANFMTGNVTGVAVETTDLILARLGVLNDGDAAADAARIKAASAQLKLVIPTILAFILGAVISAHAFIAIGFWSLLLATGLVAAAALWAAHGGSE